MSTLNAQKRTNHKTIVFFLLRILSFVVFLAVQTCTCTPNRHLYNSSPRVWYIFAPVWNYLHIVYTAVVTVFFEVHLGLEQWFSKYVSVLSWIIITDLDHQVSSLKSKGGSSIHLVYRLPLPSLQNDVLILVDALYLELKCIRNNVQMRKGQLVSQP